MDEEYINEILSTGSMRAYKSLVEKYQNRVFTLCYRIIKKREEAEEVAQDVFVKCFNDLNKLKEWNKFSNWIMKIAFSKSIDQVRKKRIKKIEISVVNESFLKDENTPLKETIKQDRRQLLETAINQLGKEEAAIITLYYIEDISVKEIGEIVGISTSNVKVKLFRARNSLKNIVASLAKNDLQDLIR